MTLRFVCPSGKKETVSDIPTDSTVAFLEKYVKTHFTDNRRVILLYKNTKLDNPKKSIESLGIPNNADIYYVAKLGATKKKRGGKKSKSTRRRGGRKFRRH